MYIEKLKLTNFRNYESLDISFSDTLNIIYGNNGSGKSNIIEAIYLLALTKSFRTSSDVNLIKKGSSLAQIKGEIITNEKNRYQIDLSNEGKKVYINSDKVGKISDYVTNINIILFNPLDTKIINDAPSFRRKLLNIDISQGSKEYLLLLNSYDKLLKNRNAYLKQLYLNGNASKDYLDILTQKLVKIGKCINNYRREYIEKINKSIAKIYEDIFEYGELKVIYNSSFNDKSEEEILDNYQKKYYREMEMGKTLSGIHHDDIEFILDGNSIKDFGSVGQQKNAIIAFKLAQILIMKEIKGEYPILILDDLFSELDNQKINNIIKMLNKEVQTFITSTNIDNIDKMLLKNSNIYLVENNKIERVSN